MDPITAMILIGGVTAGIGMMQADSQAKAASKAKRKAEDQSVRNQNALVEEGFEKRKRAMGLGMGGGGGAAAGGLAASQTGSILTSVTNGNQVSGL